MEVQKVVDWVSNSLAKACTSDDDTAKICSTLSDVTLTLHTEVAKDGKIGVSVSAGLDSLRAPLCCSRSPTVSRIPDFDTSRVDNNALREIRRSNWEGLYRGV